MASHQQFVNRLRSRPAVRAELARLERVEGPFLDLVLQSRCGAGLTLSQVARRMGVQTPTVARVERRLRAGGEQLSIRTLQRYAAACGKQLVVRFE